jgi:serine/threonine protein kinase
MTSSGPSTVYPSGARSGASTTLDSSAALPNGTRVGEFEIRAHLGSGGFGIVYLAWDHALEREVALKEYLPGTLAGRGDGQAVALRSQAQAETFALGLRSFVNEARLLARFDHPSLVKVYRFWEANGTAYMVMPYYKGRTLRQMRAGMVVPPGEAACRSVLDALLSALEILHKEGVFHRDIAPDNILIGDDGVPVLLDFGAARRVIGEGPQALTSIIKPHFAPLEQYADQGAMRQGPWTDLYALGGTIYFLLTGKEPVPAASRALHDDQPRLAAERPAHCSPGFAAAIDWMLALRPPERPQSVPMLRDVLEGRITLPGRRAGDRTVPGFASRDEELRVSIPGSLDDTDFDPTVQPLAADAQTMVLAAPSRAATGEPPRTTLPPTTAPPAAVAPAPSGPTAAPRLSRTNLLLMALVALNILAWWWSFAGRSTATPASTPVAAAAPASASASASAPTTTAPSARADAPADTGPRETVISVMPARAAKPAAEASVSASAAVQPTPRAGDGAASGPRAAAARPGEAPRPAPSPADASVGPRARCGDRVFLSMLICMKRECEAPALRNHPECVQMREQEEGSRRRDSQ